MSEWGAGYVVETAYTYGYYPELNPLRMRLALLNAGIAPPQVKTACELAFGQGLAINIHAAASEVQWWGTDFMPDQVRFAQELAAASGADVRLFDQAFAEFCARTDLPDFDYIALHGIWSWISEENRRLITDFMTRKLRLGGVVFLSYNSMPGWAPMAPVQHLIAEYAEAMAPRSGGPTPRFVAALDFVDRLIATNPGYTRVNTVVPARAKSIREQNADYATHEYLCGNWEPMYFAQTAALLQRAKLDFGCSAWLADHIDLVNLLPEQQQFLGEIPDTYFRETVRDFLTNQQFRREYWVRGARRLSALEQLEGLRRQRVVLSERASDVRMKLDGALGSATMQDSVYRPIIDVLADHRPRRVDEIEALVRDKGVGLPQVLQGLLALASNAAVYPADEAVPAARRKRTDALNAHVLEMTRGGSNVSYLASPLTGGGTSVSFTDQLLLLARSRVGKAPADWANFAWQTLAPQGKRAIQDGKVLDSVEENLEFWRRRAAELEQRLPILTALEIA